MDVILAGINPQQPDAFFPRGQFGDGKADLQLSIRQDVIERLDPGAEKQQKAQDKRESKREIARWRRGIREKAPNSRWFSQPASKKPAAAISSAYAR